MTSDRTNTPARDTTVGFAHTLNLAPDWRSSLARARDYIGQNVCVHSAPSAWYGILVSASIDAGVLCCDLADAGLWTQGTTKDLIRPAQKVTDDLQARRDGIVTVTAITAIQPAGYFTEGDPKIQDEPQLRTGRAVPPEVEGTSLEDFARFMEQEPHVAAAGVLEIYHKMGAKKGKDTDGLRGNFAGLLEFCREYAKTKNFPFRGTVAIVLAGARKYRW